MNKTKGCLIANFATVPMEQQLPPGISESGEVVDMAVYEAWQREQNPDIQQKMQRREEVNINVHRERGENVEPGDDF